MSLCTRRRHLPSLDGFRCARPLQMTVSFSTIFQLILRSTAALQRSSQWWRLMAPRTLSRLHGPVGCRSNHCVSFFRKCNDNDQDSLVRRGNDGMVASRSQNTSTQSQGSQGDKVFMVFHTPIHQEGLRFCQSPEVAFYSASNRCNVKNLHASTYAKEK